MRVIKLLVMAVLFSCVFGAIDAMAYNVYGTSAVIYDFANNRTRGYSRTQLDYDTAEYYTAYVCGEVYKDGVSQVRACQGGIITATIYTQYTGTSATGSVLSDHYVDMQYFDDEQTSYVDYYGYQFLPGYSYPTDWFFDAANIFAHYPVSIHLGSTTAMKPLIKIVNNSFDPAFVSLTGNPISTGSASISASPACSGDDNCLHSGDTVVVELIKNTSGGVFTYYPPSQNMEMALNLGGDVTANFTLTLTSVSGLSPLPKDVQFTIRVADVRRSSTGSILSTVQLDPTNGGMAKPLSVH